MHDEVFQLDQIQKWMQSVISHPEGVAAGVESAPAQEQIAVSPQSVEEVVTRSQSLSSLERLQIYANAYYTRLVECLRDEFPGVAHALGREAFDAYAVGYLQSYPSQSYTLGRLGENFPRFLAEIPLQAPPGAPEHFPDFLADLAALERCYSEVFDGPGSESQPPLSPEEFQKIPPDVWPAVRLIPVPSLRLASFRFPVHEYISGVRHEASATIPAPAETNLAINRRDFVVRRVPLNSVQFALLSNLTEGRPLGEAIEQAWEQAGADDDLAAQLPIWFQDWAARRFFSRVECPPA